MKFRKTVVEEESLLEEVAELNNQVADLMAEKESILAMKVSQLGLKPGEEIEENPEENSRLWLDIFKYIIVDKEKINFFDSEKAIVK